MTHEMTKDEWQRFLSEGTRTGKLATVRPDGSPHIAPVCFLMDGDDLVFNTGVDSVKGRNLVRDGRVALCADEERLPFSFVVVQGSATISNDLAEVRHWATRIAARYQGEDRAQEFGARHAVPGEVVVRVTIDRVVAMAALAD
ncbi:putative oxidoreductase [Streptomyces sp. NBRC 110611]|uniref:PPOX class F420-dependent oxidoreductase n=1 Tax=Streptomyces sp. NBRC 110611 TaxID=1621259 RepID=UPI00082D01DB|nr:PPOX class F420-dependent oxidoreductase [Streptomyces sp. NBRC 110611]GAU69102.1 putative oxidoreductase [Streptomyces sp. NBRC 110611]